MHTNLHNWRSKTTATSRQLQKWYCNKSETRIFAQMIITTTISTKFHIWWLEKQPYIHNCRIMMTKITTNNDHKYNNIYTNYDYNNIRNCTNYKNSQKHTHIIARICLISILNSCNIKLQWSNLWFLHLTLAITVSEHKQLNCWCKPQSEPRLKSTLNILSQWLVLV